MVDKHIGQFFFKECFFVFYSDLKRYFSLSVVLPLYAQKGPVQSSNFHLGDTHSGGAHLGGAHLGGAPLDGDSLCDISMSSSFLGWILSEETLSSNTSQGYAYLGNIHLSNNCLDNTFLRNTPLGDARLGGAHSGTIPLDDTPSGNIRLKSIPLGNSHLGGTQSSGIGSGRNRLRTRDMRERFYYLFILCLFVATSGVYALPYYRQTVYRALNIGCPGLHGYVEGTLYHQTAKRMYDACGNLLRDGSVATRVFGQQSFMAAQALTNSSVPAFSNPWLDISQFSPRLYHHEWNITSFIDISYGVSNKPLRAGLRFEIPYRIVKRFVQEPYATNSYCAGSGAFGEITANDVLHQNTDGTFAYRLDVLSRFPYDINAPGNSVPLVNYHDSTFNDNPISISNQDCTDTGGNPVVVVSSLCRPGSPNGVVESAAQGEPVLPAGGSQIPLFVYSLTNTQRFGSGINYTPLGSNADAQSTLWVEPALDDSTHIPVASARIIRTHVNELLTQYGCSARDFFTQRGFSFDSIKKHGFSDGMGELYATYQGTDFCTVEAGLRVGFPFAEKSNPYQVFDISLGTNGQYQGGIVSRVQLQDNCFAILGCAELLHVGGGTQCIAVPFVGSSVFGLSTIAQVKTSYDWYRLALQGGYSGAHVALQLLYELSATSRLQVCAHDQQYADLFGVIQSVDFSLYTRNAAQTSHTVGCMVRLHDLCIHELLPTLGGEVGVRTVLAGHNSELFATWYASLALQF